LWGNEKKRVTPSIWTSSISQNRAAKSVRQENTLRKGRFKLSQKTFVLKQVAGDRGNGVTRFFGIKERRKDDSTPRSSGEVRQGRGAQRLMGECKMGTGT